MALEIVILSEISQTEEKYRIFSFVCLLLQTMNHQRLDELVASTSMLPEPRRSWGNDGCSVTIYCSRGWGRSPPTSPQPSPEATSRWAGQLLPRPQPEGVPCPQGCQPTCREASRCQRVNPPRLGITPHPPPFYVGRIWGTLITASQRVPKSLSAATLREHTPPGFPLPGLTGSLLKASHHPHKHSTCTRFPFRCCGYITNHPQVPGNSDDVLFLPILWMGGWFL